MSNNKQIEGFSKLSKLAKLEWINDQFIHEGEDFIREMTGFWHPDEKLQKRFDEFSENTKAEVKRRMTAILAVLESSAPLICIF